MLYDSIINDFDNYTLLLFLVIFL